METFHILVTIHNKQGISDPEGETILNDLVLAEGNSAVTDIRCSKGLRFTLAAGSRTEAVREVRRICERLHIYNPLVSRIDISS